MTKFTLSIIFMALSLTAQSSNELQTVSSVNIDSYMGKWYEYARYANSFQRKCGGTTAEYKLIGHKVQVINTCQRLDKEGQLQVAQGTAFVTETTTNSKLKVSFVPFFNDGAGSVENTGSLSLERITSMQLWENQIESFFGFFQEQKHFLKKLTTTLSTDLKTFITTIPRNLRSQKHLTTKFFKKFKS